MKGILRTILKEIKGSVLVNEPQVPAVLDHDLRGMAASKGDVYGDIKGVCLREVKVTHESF